MYWGRLSAHLIFLANNSTKLTSIPKYVLPNIWMYRIYFRCCGKNIFIFGFYYFFSLLFFWVQFNSPIVWTVNIERCAVSRVMSMLNINSLEYVIHWQCRSIFRICDSFLLSQFSIERWTFALRTPIITEFSILPF